MSGRDKVVYRSISSANKLTFDCRDSCKDRQCLYYIKSRGPKTEPWGILHILSFLFPVLLTIRLCSTVLLQLLTGPVRNPTDMEIVGDEPGCAP